jgi:hypothetical protein
MASVEWIDHLGSQHHRLDRGNDAGIHGIARLVLKEGLGWVRTSGILLAFMGVLVMVSDGNITSISIGKFGAPGDILIRITAVMGSILNAFTPRLEIASGQLDDVLCDVFWLGIFIVIVHPNGGINGNPAPDNEWLDRGTLPRHILLRAGIHRMVRRTAGPISRADRSLLVYRAAGGSGCRRADPGEADHMGITAGRRGDSVWGMAG